MNITTIQIREQAFENNIFQVIVTFYYADGNTEEIPTPLQNPFHEETDQLLEEYFEEYIRKPYDDIPIQDAPKAIEDYGIQLFKQLFEGEANFPYRTILQQATPENIVFEIIGKTPAFQSIYWESLRNPKSALPLAAEGAIFRRKNTKSKTVKAIVNSSPTINLLIVTARPNEAHDVNYRTIQRPLVKLIQKATLKVKPHILRPGTYESFVRHLDEVGAKYYHIIHFDLHGALLDYSTYEALQKEAAAVTFTNWSFQNTDFNSTYALPELPAYEDKKAFLFFESTKKGTAIPVEAEQLATLLENKQVPVVLLNACQSAKQDNSDHETSLGQVLIQKGIQLVLAMRYSVSVSAAKILMKALYQKLCEGEAIEKAIASARKDLYRNSTRQAAFNRKIELQDWLLPVVYQNGHPNFRLRPFTIEEEIAFANQSIIPQEIRQVLPHGFSGRDLDILLIEKTLLTRNNILLLRGMGGAGKTTLLKYLVTWWLKTGFIQKVFYFGYELKAFTLADILRMIAQSIYSQSEYEQFRLLPEQVQQQRIIDILNTNEYALILDNAESITGVNLAIKNTLTESQRSELKQFLTDLKGGKNRIIIGSRSPEEWLKNGTFGSNHLILGGLDEESAKNFADAIIKDLGISIKYIAKDEHFERLLKLLGGFPLALKAILPNLKNKTARVILEELEKGLEGLDTEKMGDKTKSIVKCIEYSHSNLSEDAQKLLLCLAPFQGVVNLEPKLINIYFDELRKDKIFQSYPFDKISLVLKDAIKNGFIERYNHNSQVNFMKLQPVFTYFLKNQLLTQNDTIKSKLTEAFINYCLKISYVFDLPFGSMPLEYESSRFVYAGLEFENINKALFLQIDKNKSFLSLLLPLSEFFDKTAQMSQKVLFFEKIDKKLREYNYIDGSHAEEVISFLDLAASTYKALSDFEEASNIYTGIIQLIEKKENLKNNAALKKFKSSVYQKHGIIFYELGYNEKAKELYNLALESFKEHGGDQHNLGRILVVLGNISRKEGNDEEAKKLYLEGLEIAKRENDYHSQGSIFMNLGNFAFIENNLMVAKDYFYNSLHIFQQLNALPEEGKAITNLGSIYLSEKNYEEAKNYFQKAYNIFEQIEDKFHQATVIVNLARVSFF